MQVLGAAAVGGHASEQVRRDGDVARGCDLVGKFLRPVTQTKNLVNDEHDGALVFRFGIRDQRVHGAAVVLDGDPFAMAGRFASWSLSPACAAANFAGERKATAGEQNPFIGPPSFKEPGNV